MAATGAFRDDPFGADLAHRREELQATADNAIDRNEAWASCRADHATQQRFAILNRAWAEIVAVEVKKVEGEMGELVVSALETTLRRAGRYG